MSTTTTRLGLILPAGTDAENLWPTAVATSFGVLDNATIYQSGTLSGKPAATSVAEGTIYFATDTGAMLMACTPSGGGRVWVWMNANTEPVGYIKAYANTTIPADADGQQRWHVCDGSTVGRISNAALFSAIGTTWGTGDGSTTFNLPDLRGRTLVSRGTGAGLSTYTIAETGGSEAVTLSSSQLPAHNHPVSDPGHVHGVTDPGHVHLYANITNVETGIAAGSGWGGRATSTTSSTTGISINSHTTGLTVGNNTGGGGSVDLLNPFACISYAIKISSSTLSS